MVEKLVNSTTTTKTAAVIERDNVPLDPHIIKEMNKVTPSPDQNNGTETNGDEDESESETTQVESDEDNCKNGDGNKSVKISNNLVSKKSKKEVNNRPQSQKRAKKGEPRENHGRFASNNGTSSDSLKTTPDSSLDPPSSNYNTLDKGPLNIRALPFESGINTECIQLLRQLWNLHDEALQFLHSVHLALSTFRRWARSEDNENERSSLQDKKPFSGGAFNQQRRSDPLIVRGKSNNFNNNCKSNSVFGSTGGEEGGLFQEDLNEDEIGMRWIPLQPFIDGLKCISDNISEIEKQCLTLSVFHSQCKLVLFTKINHAKRQVTHDRLAILYSINQLVTGATSLLSSPSFWHSPDSDVVGAYAYSVFFLAETYNASLESCWTHVEASLAATNPSLSTSSSFPTADADSGNENGIPVTVSKIRVLVQVRAANTNDASLIKQSLKPVSATKILQVVGQRRAFFSAFEFSKSCFATFYESQRQQQQNEKEQQNGLKVEKFSHFIEDESLHLNPFEKAFSKRPSLLGRAAVKENEKGEFRLTKKFKLKMYSYFHEILWSMVGDYSEDLILWSPQSAVPLVLQSAQMQIEIRQLITSGALAKVGMPQPLCQAFEALSGALYSFSLMVNWDERMREAFELTFKIKRPEHVAILISPQPLEMATEVGKTFKEMVSSCLSLMESGNAVNSRMSLPLAERQQLVSLFGEEEPLGDEAQILFRLEASLNYFRVWTIRRAKVWLNAWAVTQFIAASQRDPAILAQVMKSKETFLITREALLKSENVAIRIGAKSRQMCSDDMKTAIVNMQKLPDELLDVVGIVCRTLSLATLQSYMPSPPHWRGSGKHSGLDPDRPSPYVKIFIDRVVEPVFRAAVKLVPGLVQESLGKQVINAMCDAWLHYILQKKIKFSEWGAVQLLRDFVALREWIRNEEELDPDARKAILQLEVLKSCEGVAYLLLRNPGDVLGVGKAGRKNRRVAPSSSTNNAGAGGVDSIENSPSPSEGSTTEDAIPPEMYVPNQQLWLQLRLKKTSFSTCCNF